MNRSKKIIQLSFLGILVNLVLVAFKAFVGIIANSISVILDAINNLSDALSQVITIIGIKLSILPPTKRHPFGYGRIEYITNQVLAGILIALGIISIKESIEKIINPSTDLSFSVVTLVIIFVTVLVKLVYGLYIKHQGKKLASTSLNATGTDALLDSLLTLSTFLCGLIYLIWGLNFEGIVGCIISIFIIKVGVELMLETINSLIGARTDKEVSDKLKEIVTSDPKVQGAYDLIINEYGPLKQIASIHIELSDDIRASEIHTLTRDISERVFKEMGIILTIGIYASNDEQKELKDELKSIISKYESIKELHGFYIDSYRKIISFDLVFDYDKNDKLNIIKEVKETLYSHLTERNSQYASFDINIVLDNEYSD